MIETRTDVGIFAQVGEAGKLFTFADYRGHAITFALRWEREQQEFQHYAKSNLQVHTSFYRLNLLLGHLKADFPVDGTDYKFILDDHLCAIGLVFGSLLVFESDNGFNIELVVNWLTKERRTVCTGISEATTVEVIRNSEQSRNFQDIEPRMLFLSQNNLETVKALCGLG